MKSKIYQVTPQTDEFIQALKEFNSSQLHIMQGLILQYGEELGNKAFDNYFGERFKDAERIYFDALGMSMLDTFTNGTDNEI